MICWAEVGRGASNVDNNNKDARILFIIDGFRIKDNTDLILKRYVKTVCKIAKSLLRTIPSQRFLTKILSDGSAEG